MQSKGNSQHEHAMYAYNHQMHVHTAMKLAEL